ncbi:MAG: calcium-activated chloride channel-domain-containing protein, partial [Olpidium bornovanus]
MAAENATRRRLAFLFSAAHEVWAASPGLAAFYLDRFRRGVAVEKGLVVPDEASAPRVCCPRCSALFFSQRVRHGEASAAGEEAAAGKGGTARAGGCKVRVRAVPSAADRDRKKRRKNNTDRPKPNNVDGGADVPEGLSPSGHPRPARGLCIAAGSGSGGGGGTGRFASGKCERDMVFVPTVPPARVAAAAAKGATVNVELTGADQQQHKRKQNSSAPATANAALCGGLALSAGARESSTVGSLRVNIDSEVIELAGVGGATSRVVVDNPARVFGTAAVGGGTPELRWAQVGGAAVRFGVAAIGGAVVGFDSFAVAEERVSAVGRGSAVRKVEAGLRVVSGKAFGDPGIYQVPGTAAVNEDSHLCLAELSWELDALVVFGGVRRSESRGLGEGVGAACGIESPPAYSFISFYDYIFFVYELIAWGAVPTLAGATAANLDAARTRLFAAGPAGCCYAERPCLLEPVSAGAGNGRCPSPLPAVAPRHCRPSPYGPGLEWGGRADAKRSSGEVVVAQNCAMFPAAASASSGDLAFARNRAAALAGRVPDAYSDYVIDFGFPLEPGPEVAARYPELARAGDGAGSRADLLRLVESAYAGVVTRLARAGLDVEVRRADRGRLFLFVNCPARRLDHEALRVNDFLSGVRGAHLNFGGHTANDRMITKAPITTAERLRLVYGIITGSSRNGGAGVIPNETEFVRAVFPLHDRKLNKVNASPLLGLTLGCAFQAWIKEWSLKWSLNQDDLNRLRDQYGEQVLYSPTRRFRVGYYFAFLQCYFVWLLVPAAAGLPFYLTGSYFSVFHGIFTVVWSTLFVAYWRRRERELAVLWDVRETSRVEHPRPGFVPESEVADPVTDEKVPYYPVWKRCLRRAVTLPLVAGIGSLLMLLIGSIFAFEVFMTEFYRGPGLALLVRARAPTPRSNGLFSLCVRKIYSPTVIYSSLVPAASSMYCKLARRLTTFENHETETNDDASLTQKISVFTFMVSYLSIFLTAYVYIPFSGNFENWLRKEGQIHTRHVVVNRDRIVGQLIYFVLVCYPVINFANEVIVPYITRFGRKKLTGIAAKRGATAARRRRAGRRNSASSSSASSGDEREDEAQARFIRRVRSEADKPPYDLYGDFAEMVAQ